MKTTVQVTYSFKEELIGDEQDSDKFYLKVTPIVKIKPKEYGTPDRKDLKAIAEAVLKESRKKGPIK